MTRRRIFAGLAASALVLAAAWVDGGDRRSLSPAEECADRLGIAYDVAEGATERLDAFKACVEATR